MVFVKDGEIYEFGRFHLFVSEQLLLLEDEKVALTPKAFETLVLLVRAAGHIVDRNDLMMSLWPDAVVTEANLTQTIWMLRKALGEGEDRPRFIETVPRRGYRFVASVRQVSEADLGCPAEPERPGDRGGPAQLGRRRALIGAGAFVLVALAVVSYVVLKGRVTKVTPTGSADSSSTEITVRPAVAVWGFRNLSGRPEVGWLSTALAEMLSAELAAGERLRAVPGEVVARTKVDLSLGDADSLAPDSLTRVRRTLGADLLVHGSYLRLQASGGWKIRLDVRVQDAVNGEVVVTATATGTEEELLELVSEIGAQLRQKLGAGSLSPAEAASVRAAFPADPEAARLYAEGLMKLRLFDAVAARDRLATAAGLAPNNALIHSALATAWSTLGYDQRACEEARKAFEMSANLARKDALYVESRYRLANRELDKAVELCRALWTFFPDDIEQGLGLVDAQVSDGRAGDALATISEIRRLPLPLSDDPRIDLAEASAAAALSDFKRSKASAAKAAEKGSVLGARLLVARARLAEGMALQNLGELTGASVAFADTTRLHAGAGDRGGMAGALFGGGVVRLRQGDFAGAEMIFEEALAIYREVGNMKDVARTLNGLGNVLSSQGDITGAERRYRESIAAYRDTGHKSGVAMALNGLGAVLIRAGQPAEARQALEESVALKREMGDRGGIANVLINLATLLAIQGDLVGAGEAYAEVLPIERAIGARSAVALTLQNAAILVAVKRGDIRGAMVMCEESLAISREIGEKSGVVAALVSIGFLQHLEGDVGAAEKTLDSSLALSREIGHGIFEGYALFDLAEVLSAEGDLGAARRAHDEALAIRKKMGEVLAVADSQLGLASLGIEEGGVTEAETLARAALLVFQAKGLVDRQAAAREILARALFGRGARAEAQQEIDHARGLLEKSGNRRLRSLVGLTAARIRGAVAKSADIDQVLKEVGDVATWASSTGDVPLELEARLVMGEIELRSGSADAALVHIDALNKEAKSKGFVLIARKAARLASQDHPDGSRTTQVGNPR
ncbi:MAG: tetratricopeptide repeat protein [Acidobacteria bacterium]|nr:tetratricopeptide repeat protein [Acidobacteriota bacterium]